MINATNYLDLYSIFFNEIAGSVIIGVLLGLLVIWIGSSRKGFQLPLFFFFGLLWLSVVYIGNVGLTIIWLLVVIAVGGTFYYNVAKALGRGG